MIIKSYNYSSAGLIGYGEGSVINLTMKNAYVDVNCIAGSVAGDINSITEQQEAARIYRVERRLPILMVKASSTP